MSARDTDHHQLFDETITTRPATDREIAYRNGYVQGRALEQTENYRRRTMQARIREQQARLRAENGAASGVIIGFLIALIAAVVGSIVYFAGDRNPEVQTPEPATTAPEPTNQETTIIERTIERTQQAIPVPQRQAPSNQGDQPIINIELTNPIEATPTNPTPEQPATPEATPPQSEPTPQPE
jgi:hypothetical protein